MPRLCIFNSMSKLDDTGRVLMSPLWDLLIHCFGTRLANTRENFDVPSEKTSQQFLFMFAVFEIVRADSSLCILSLRSGFGFAFLLGLKLILFFIFLPSWFANQTNFRLMRRV